MTGLALTLLSFDHSRAGAGLGLQGGLPELRRLFLGGNGIEAAGARALWDAAKGRSDEDKAATLTIDLRHV